MCLTLLLPVMLYQIILPPPCGGIRGKASSVRRLLSDSAPAAHCQRPSSQMVAATRESLFLLGLKKPRPKITNGSQGKGKSRASGILKNVENSAPPGMRPGLNTLATSGKGALDRIQEPRVIRPNLQWSWAASPSFTSMT